jgi:hypothetical protein
VAAAAQSLAQLVDLLPEFRTINYAKLVAELVSVPPRVSLVMGAPTFLRSDNRPEFVSKTLLSGIVAQGIGTALGWGAAVRGASRC